MITKRLPVAAILETDMNATISTDNARRFLAIGFCGMAVFCAFVVASLVS